MDWEQHLLRERVGQEYKDLIGYNCFEDDPSMPTEEAIRVLKEYKKEARSSYPKGSACGAIGCIELAKVLR